MSQTDCRSCLKTTSLHVLLKSKKVTNWLQILSKSWLAPYFAWKQKYYKVTCALFLKSVPTTILLSCRLIYSSWDNLDETVLRISLKKKKNCFTFYNCIVSMGFLPWEIRVGFLGKTNCGRVMPPNLWCMLNVWVFPQSTERWHGLQDL